MKMEFAGITSSLVSLEMEAAYFLVQGLGAFLVSSVWF